MAASRIGRVIKIAPRNTVFFASPGPAIHAFDNVLGTANKMLKVAKVLNIPVVATEQNPKGLGPTVPDLALSTLGLLHLGTYPKTLFSMLTPDLTKLLATYDPPIKSVVLFGIESHVCVLHTALDLLELELDVHVLADGVSSCNKEEISIALDRMRQAGAKITTSESISFQLMVDSAYPNFKALAAVVKEEKESTKTNLQALL